MELRCSGYLAMWLGAVMPASPAEHREMRDAGHLLVRDPRTGWPLFWPWLLNPAGLRRKQSR